jgi:hypothetical protein
MSQEIEIPDFKIVKAYEYLFKPARYKVRYGGRGGGSTWNYARALLLRAMQRKTRIVCFREIQNSIDESIRHTLEEQAEKLKIDKYFTFLNRSIVCDKNGSEFIFEGLFRNVNKVKSLNAIDIADVEEAETVSDNSWKVLIPTVRREWSKCCKVDIDIINMVCPKCGNTLSPAEIEYSEIWLRFNTRYVDDPTYERFVKKPPEDAIVCFINWDQNPFFPEVLKREKDQDYALRPHEAKNIWGGEPIGMGRKVWPEFDEKVHIREFPMKLIADRGNCFMACDPAQHYYPACLFMAIIPKNERKRWPDDFVKFIYSEWPTRDDLGDYFHDIRKKLVYTGTLSDMAKNIYLAEGLNEYGIKIIKRGIDTRFAKGSGSGNYFSGESTGLVSEFAKKENGGLIFTLPNEKIIDIQKDNIHKDFAYNTLIPINSFNEPSLFISAKCQNLIMSLKNHRLKEDAEVESEKYKDFSDTLKILYATINNFEYDDPQMRQQAQEQYVDTRQYYNNSGDRSQAWMG